MFYLTEQEKYFLTVLCIIVFTGSSLFVCFKKYPQILFMTSFIDSSQSFLQIDINTATEAELLAIPYIGKYTADKILFHRKYNGLFQSMEEVRHLKGIHENSFKHFSRYLKVGL